MSKKIIHIDADCFYAAIEMRDDPSLSGVPFAVGGRSDRRGVLTTCNYPARSYGVRSAMPTSQALRLCPQLIVRPPNFEKYRAASRQMHEVFERYTDQIEPLSLDEAFLDVTDSHHCDGSATRIAEAIRAAILREIGITVSAGISVNKFIAKVASDWDKPDGLTVVEPEQVDQFAAELPVKLIPGVGKVTCEKLHRLGFKYCADIRSADPGDIHRRFGSFGHTLIERAFGRDDRPVNPDRLRKSISVEHTYADDVPNGDPCLAKLSELMVDLNGRIEAANAGAIIQKAFVKVKFNDFSTTTVEKAGTTARISDYRALLQEGLSRKQLPIRLLGIGVRLLPQEGNGGKQLPLGIDEGATTGRDQPGQTSQPR